MTGPGNQEWRIPVKLDAAGGFYHKFDAQTPATGDYSVQVRTGRAEAKGEEARKRDARRDEADEAG